MTKAKPEAALSLSPPPAAPVPAGAPSAWALTAVSAWINQNVAHVSVDVETPTAGQTYVAAAARELESFEGRFRAQALALPEHAAALSARAALVSALARQAQVREALRESASAAIDWADGQVAAVAHREAEWREQADLIDRRLPDLRERLATATRALESSASQLHARMRLAAVDATRGQLQQLAGLLAEESVGAFGELVRLESLRQSLAVPFDNVHGETFAKDAIAPVPPAGPPPPNLTITNPFALPGANAARLLPGQPVLETNGIPAAALPPSTTVVKAGPSEGTP
jgi:hypothetical protein